MTLKGILLAGAALCTISLAPAFARSVGPQFAVAALHQGRTVVKTSMHAPKANHITSSGDVSTSISTADYKKKTNLIDTFYTYLSSGSFCNIKAKMKVKLSTTKTKYAMLSTGTVSYSEGCGTPTKFYGDVYDLTTKKAFKKPDTFTSTLIGKGFMYEGEKYDGKLILAVSVSE